MFSIKEQEEITNSFNYHAKTLDNSLLPLSLKLRTFFIPFSGIRGMKFWAKYYCSLRKSIIDLLLKMKNN